MFVELVLVAYNDLVVLGCSIHQLQGSHHLEPEHLSGK